MTKQYNLLLLLLWRPTVINGFGDAGFMVSVLVFLCNKYIDKKVDQAQD